MTTLSSYWHLWRISLSDGRRRYQRDLLSGARDFFEDCLAQAKACTMTADAAQQTVQSRLLSQFRPLDRQTATAPRQRAYAGLCLRCYLSEPILRACQKLDSLFSGNKAFSYQDLLPFVLNDNGETLIVLDEDEKTQLLVDKSDRLRPSTFKVFAVEVLRTYKANSASSMSLNNWAFLQTKQHSELKKFLSEFGFQQFSDWALLNRARLNQVERLSERERDLVNAFHAVYRRDRRAQKQISRCQNPDVKQLAEMSQLLRKGGDFDKASDLLKSLKQVAQQLRQFDLWQSREPLEVKDIETGSYSLRTDLPAASLDEIEIEEQSFLDFLQQQFDVVLASAVEQAVRARIAKLKKSKKYAPFAESFLPGLQLYYQEGYSLKDIGSQLGASSWDQTRRIFNPGALLSQVRLLVSQQLLEVILKQAQDKGLAATPADPSYLKTLMEQIEAYIDDKVFVEAASEIKAGKHRSLDSEYAAQLKRYIQQSLP